LIEKHIFTTFQLTISGKVLIYEVQTTNIIIIICEIDNCDLTFEIEVETLAIASLIDFTSLLCITLTTIIFQLTIQNGITIKKSSLLI